MNKRQKKKKMERVNVIIAPREPAPCAIVPGRGLILLDRPENPGFKAWVEGRKGIWEHGNSREEALKRMKISLPCWNLRLKKVIQQTKPEWN